MLGIHRTQATAQGRGPASRPRHRSSRRRLILEPLEERALLSSWTVNSLGDTGTGTDQTGDLRYCITQANQNIGDDTINFGVTGTITLNSALPDLSDTTGLTDIEGPGADALSISGNGAFPVFQVGSAVTANLAALTITGGLATAEGNDYAGGGVYSSGSLDVTNCNIEGNSSPSSGGGIYNAGTMTITGCTIANNTACFDLYGGWGAGIYNSGTMTVTGSSISNNSAGQVADGVVQGSGGGIDNDGVMSLLDCQISGNVCPSNGGGILSSGTLVVSESNISGNQAQGMSGGGAAIGGGICVVSGSLQVISSTIGGNACVGGSGDNQYIGYPTGGGSALGGGIFISNATASITNSTISGNLVTGGPGGGWEQYTWGCCYGYDWYQGYGGGEGSGGGLYYGGSSGSLALANDTISNNFASGGNGGYQGYAQYGGPDQIISEGSGGASVGGGIAVATGSASAMFVNDTIAGNSSTGGIGGGYWNYAQFNGEWPPEPITSLEFQAATYGGGLGVVSGTSTLNNTIVIQNSTDIGGTVAFASACNLIGTGGSGGLVDGVNGNKVGVADPGLGTLTNNGGPTLTMALLPGSPAINAGSNDLAVDPSTGQPLTTDSAEPGSRGSSSARLTSAPMKSSPKSRATSVWAGGTRPPCFRPQAMACACSLRVGIPTCLGSVSTRFRSASAQAATLSAGDITVMGSSGINHGPVTVSGSGTNYTITFGQAINGPDQVTVTIGNALIATFTRRLDVLPGDVNDDGVVNAQDMVIIRNQITGYGGGQPTIFGDINGDGVVNYQRLQRPCGSGSESTYDYR